MSKQITVITGGTDGIGRQAALRLAARGHRLILVGRSQKRADEAIAAIQEENPEADVAFWQADLSLMQEAQRLAERVNAELPRLDALIHCAGVMLPKRTLTDEGIETVFAVQYLSRWYLNQAVLPALQTAESPCVISVSAGGAFRLRLDWNNLMGERFYHGAVALIHESIANDMQMLVYEEEYQDVRFYCYGPYWVPGTGLMATMPAWFRWVGDVMGKFIGYTPEAAGDDIVSALETRPDATLIGRKLKPAQPTRWKADRQNQDRLWQVSERLVNQALAEPEGETTQETT